MQDPENGTRSNSLSERGEEVGFRSGHPAVLWPTKRKLHQPASSPGLKGL